MTRRMTGPLSVEGAEAYVAATCFKTGPPGKVGVELELFALDPADPARAVDATTLQAVLADAGPLPADGLLTAEPGGQLELSSQPASSLEGCAAAVGADLAQLRSAAATAGLLLAGIGTDPYRRPLRVIDLPRYAAMETFFDRFGPEGRVMMCSTASVQVCLDVGLPGRGASGYRRRWHLVHALAPVLVAAFANSPLRVGRPTGWRSTRQAVWARLDPSRTAAPGDGGAGGDPAAAWAKYALDAQVLCVRNEGSGPWTVPAGLTFRAWLRGGGPRPATQEDLRYHLTTLFPPVRPRGWLELRMIDAQPGDDWIVPTAVVTALVDDEIASDAALAAAEPLGDTADPALWTRAARDGLTDPDLHVVAVRCFSAALCALDRLDARSRIKAAVEAFMDSYVTRGRCPADDRLEEWRRRAGKGSGLRSGHGSGRGVPSGQEVAWC
jgi:glutamate--cysteine ligase